MEHFGLEEESIVPTVRGSPEGREQDRRQRWSWLQNDQVECAEMKVGGQQHQITAQRVLDARQTVAFLSVYAETVWRTVKICGVNLCC